MRRPFRSTLDSFSSLQARIRSETQKRLRHAEQLLQNKILELIATLLCPSKELQDEVTGLLAAISYPNPTNDIPLVCDPILQEHCTLCFGGVYPGHNP